MTAVASNQALCNHPQLKPLNALVARLNLEIITYSAIFVVFMAGAEWPRFDISVADTLAALCVLLALRGRNGAGKTTLLRLLGGVDRLSELQSRQGRSTFIVASHNMQMVRKMCDVGIVIRDGEVTVRDIDEAVEIYGAG